jgi:hypothetical protein
MKRIFFILGLFVSLYLSGQQVYVDSLDYSLLVGTDTVLFPDIGRVRAGSVISVEIVYTTLNAATSYVAPGFSNKGNTFNKCGTLFGASTDSILLNTANAKIVKGYSHMTGISGVATAQSSLMFVGDKSLGKWFGLWFKKGTVTSGKVYYYILKL